MPPPSSAYSSRRGMLRRPKICKPPPPPPPPPLPGHECDLIADAEEVEPGGEVSVTLFAHQFALAPGEPVAVAGTVTCGAWDYPDPLRNDEAGEPSLWTAPFDPGVCTLCATFTFPDLTTCHACVDIEVLDEEEPPP